MPRHLPAGLLAEAGILDGLRATTLWWLSPVFRGRCPTVELDESRMVVAPDSITTLAACIKRDATRTLNRARIGPQSLQIHTNSERTTHAHLPVLQPARTSDQICESRDRGRLTQLGWTTP
jgi:hypothetical protein